MIRTIAIWALCVLAAWVVGGCAPEASVPDAPLAAVAANFAPVAEALVEQFERDTGQRVGLVVGSTGKLYAQIRSGAPYDLFLAADQERPRLLEEDALAVAGSRATYARGALALVAPTRSWQGEVGPGLLRSAAVRRIAIANPELAPYGLASREVLEGLGVWNDLASRLVLGENVGQTFALVASGSVGAALVSRSSLTGEGGGSELPVQLVWEVPAELHAPIRQDAVLLARARDNEVAHSFLRYLGSEAARALKRRHGYLDDK